MVAGAAELRLGGVEVRPASGSPEDHPDAGELQLTFNPQVPSPPGQLPAAPVQPCRRRPT